MFQVQYSKKVLCSIQRKKWGCVACWANQQQQNQKQQTRHTEIPNSTSHATQASLWLPQARAWTECCQYLACSSVDSSGLCCLSCQRWLCRSIFLEIIVRSGSGKWTSCIAFFIAAWKEDVLQFIASYTKQFSAPDWNWLDQDRLHLHYQFLSMCVAVMEPILNLFMIQNGRGHW